MASSFYAEFSWPYGLTFAQQKLNYVECYHNFALRYHSHRPRIVKYQNPTQRFKVSTESARPTVVPSYYGFEENHFLKLLHKSCKSGNYDEGFYFLESMVNLGYRADVILSTKLIKGLSNSNNVLKAVKVMRILEKHGEPDVFAYNTLICGLCKGNLMDAAEEVLSSMRARGFSPDVVTYNILIGSLCKRGEFNLALKMFDQLLRDNCQPNVVTYTILIEATILQGGIDEAMKLFDEMFCRGLQPDMHTYNTIIGGMCKEGLMNEAFEFVRSFRTRGCNPDVVSYNILLSAFMNQGISEDWEKAMTEMMSTNRELNVPGILIGALCRDGQLNEAMRLLKIMLDGGFTANAFTCDPLFWGLCKEGRLDLAVDYIISSGRFCDVVDSNGVVPSALCRDGNADEALEVFGKLDETGSPPDVSTYNTMISALWNMGEGTKALKLVTDMIRRGIDPDKITYNSLISCLCREGMVDGALELLADMNDRGFVPTVVTYNIVLLGLCKAHRMDEATEMLAEMVKRGCQPNGTTYSLLIEGIGYSGWPEEAMVLANTLRKENIISQLTLRRLEKTFRHL